MSKSIYLLLIAVLLVLILGASYLVYVTKNLPPTPPPTTPTPMPTQPTTAYLILTPKLVADGANTNLEIYVSPQQPSLNPLSVLALKLDLNTSGGTLTPKASSVQFPDTLTQSNWRSSFNRVVTNDDNSVSAEFSIYSIAPEGYQLTGETLLFTLPIKLPTTGATNLTVTIDPTPDISEGFDKQQGKIEFINEGQPIALQ